MPLSLKKSFDDGATEVVDTDDNKIFILKPGQWEEVQGHAPAAQRGAAEDFEKANGESWRKTGSYDSPLGSQASQNLPTTEHGQ